jgi:apolipoprotein N-acyltransferase
MFNKYFQLLKEKITTTPLFVVSGVIMGLGFFTNFSWVLGLTGIFIFLVAISKAQTLKAVVGGSYLTWTISSGLAVSVFWSVYPIEWVDLGLGRLEIVVIGAKWLITTILLGSGGAVFGAAYWFAKKYFSFLTYILLIPLIWVLAEVSQSFIYSVFVVGPGMTANIYNSTGYVGYLFSSHSGLLNFAKIGGVYSMSFVAVLLGSGLYYIFSQYPFKFFARTLTIGFIVLLFSSASVFLEQEKTSAGITVAVVETRFGGKDYYGEQDVWEYRGERLNEAVAAAMETGASYVVLPEDSRFTEMVDNPDVAYRTFSFLNKRSEVVLIDTSRVLTSGDEAALRGFVYDGVAQKMRLADKQYLTPLGEYFPYTYGYALSIFGLHEQATKMNKELSYRPGVFKSQSDFPDYLPRILFCFEVLNPISVRSLVKNAEVPFVAHPISHAWFHDSRLLERQLDNMLKVQSVWNQVTIISAANMTSSKIYSPDGSVIEPVTTVEGENWQVKLINL